jgi:hypothetical protein
MKLTLIISFVLFLFIAIATGYYFTRNFSKLGTDFLNLLNEKKFEHAHNMFSDDLKNVIPFNDFKDNFDFDFKINKISWSSRVRENNIATVKGSIVFENGEKFYTTIVFLNINKDWKITEIDISPYVKKDKYTYEDIKNISNIFIENLYKEDKNELYKMLSSEIRSNVSFEEFEKSVSLTYGEDYLFIPNVSWKGYSMVDAIYKIEGSFVNQKQENIQIKLEIIEESGDLKISYFKTE